jgi:peptidoglycan/xylan/chitin deacetylase (PgdA/CDA1 family)
MNFHIKSLMLTLLIIIIPGCRMMNSSPKPSNTITAIFTPPSVTSTPFVPTPTPLPTQTTTASATPTPVWVFQTGTITCPILLYHRIADPPSPNSSDARYYMPPIDFEWQMNALKDWGYTTIPISLLVSAITKGAYLPPRPVVISFDDGYQTVFTNAYPIMKKLGFSGVMYIVEEYIGAQGYMSIDQLTEMAKNDWEIGSHSMTHPHLPANHDIVNFEAGQSKRLLASEIGGNVLTFAYPYGEIDGFVVDKVAEYGYLAAVGLGTQYVHSLKTLYYLSRIEIRNGIDTTTFASMLPWADKP